MSTHNSTESPLAQAVENLRDVKERLRGAFGYPAVTGPQAERIAHILAGALTNIDERLSQLELESCNRVSTARLEVEAPSRQQLPMTLMQLLADCRHCRGSYEIVEIGGCSTPISHYARCSDPTCAGHGEYYPVSAEVAQRYEDRLQAEDASFGVQREAQS